jgi:hypothetical protein
VREATPPSGQLEPVNLKLQAGAVTETVEVTAADSTVRAMPARAGIGGAVAEMKKAKAALPEFPYHLLQRAPGGELVEVRAEETVPTGSTLILRAVPGADGYLRILVDGRTIATPKVKRNVTSETALPPFDKVGRVAVQVYYSRQAQESKGQTVTPAFTIAINIR